jgi:hypothetical protein
MRLSILALSIGAEDNPLVAGLVATIPKGIGHVGASMYHPRVNATVLGDKE